jgi:dihydrofolate reductase
VGRLIYAAIASLDGYIADAQGNFDWAEPDAEVHRFINELERPIGTYLYGRRMYEVMVSWEDPDAFTDQPAFAREFSAIWRAAEKVVYSTSLERASSARTRVERRFDLEAVGAMKSAATGDLSIGGPQLAAHAIKAGLVDEWQLFFVPVLVGGGTPIFPVAARARLALTEQRRFGNGTVFLRYRTA